MLQYGNTNARTGRIWSVRKRPNSLIRPHQNNTSLTTAPRVLQILENKEIDEVAEKSPQQQLKVTRQ
jgi:hypothetical protein